MEISIQHQHQLTNGEFFIEDEQQEKIAYVTYNMVDDNTMSIDHTVVKPIAEGQGIGRKLVNAAVQFARDKKYKIIPVCTYAASVFAKTPEYADVLAQ